MSKNVTKPTSQLQDHIVNNWYQCWKAGIINIEDFRSYVELGYVSKWDFQTVFGQSYFQAKKPIDKSESCV